MVALISSLAVSGTSCFAQSDSKDSAEDKESTNDRIARVQIGDTGTGYKTVLTGEGELLRGSPVMVFKYRRGQVLEQGSQEDFDYVYSKKYWDDLAALGLNSVRLVAFDPWQRSHGDAGSDIAYPYADLWDQKDIDAMYKDFDKVVEMAEARGMYVLINYHDTGGFRDPTGVAGEDRHFEYARSIHYFRRFWVLVAERYGKQTNVFFELANEPVQWHPNDYNSQDIAGLMDGYETIRRYAPDTHVILGSFATPATWIDEKSMLAVAEEFKTRGVTFENESIGFHPYQLADPFIDETGKQRLDIVSELKRVADAGIALVNTEQNFPTESGLTSDPQAPPLFKEHSTGVQSMESMGISWFHWNTAGPEEFSNLVYLTRDAKAKGYSWLIDQPEK